MARPLKLFKKELSSDKVSPYLPEGTSYTIVDKKLVFTLPSGEKLTEGDDVFVKITIARSKGNNGNERKG